MAAASVIFTVRVLTGCCELMPFRVPGRCFGARDRCAGIGPSQRLGTEPWPLRMLSGHRGPGRLRQWSTRMGAAAADCAASLCPAGAPGAGLGCLEP